MRRTLRIIRRLLLVIVLLAAAGLAAWVFVLPGIVEGQIRKALAAAGLPDADFRLREVSLTGAVLADVTLDPGSHVTVGSIVVDYDLDSLRASRVEKITVTGLVLRIGIRPDGSLDMGPLDDLKTGEADEGGELPFDRVVIRSATVVITRQEETWRLPFDAEILPGEGDLAASGVVALLNREIRLDATWTQGTGEVRAQAELAGVRGERLSLLVRSSGDVADGNLTVKVRAGKELIDSVFDGHRVRLEHPSLDGRVELEGFTRLASAEVTAGFDSVALDGLRLGAGEIEVRPGEREMDIEAVLRRDATAVTVFTSLPPLELDRLFEEDRELRVSVELTHGEDLADVPLPPEAKKALAGIGLLAETAHAQADAVLDLKLGPSGWSAAVEVASILLRTPEITRPDGTGVRDLDVDARLFGKISPETADATVLDFLRIEGDPVHPGVLAGGHFVLSMPEGASDTPRFSWSSEGWGVTAPELRAEAEIRELEVGPLSVEAISAMLAFRVEATGAGGSLKLTRDLALDSTGSSVANLGPLDAEVLFHRDAGLAWGGSADDLRYDVPQATISVSADVLEVPDAFRLERPQAFILAGFEGSLRAIEGRILPGSGLEVTRVTAAGHELAPLIVTARMGRPIELRAERQDGLSATLDGALDVAGFQVEGPTATAGIESLSLGGALAMNADGLVGAGGLAEFRASRLDLSQFGTTMESVEGRIPLGTGDETRLDDSAWLVREGYFRMDRLTWRGKDLPPIAIDLAREGPKMDFRTEWQLTETAALTAEGTAALRDGLPVTDLTVRVPRFALQPGGRISEALARATGYSFTGEAEMAGEISLSDSGQNPDLRIRVHDANITSSDGERSFTGVNADVRIRSFATFETPGAQEISFREAKVGEIVVSDGALRFQIEDLRSILLERAEWRLGETGKFWAYALRLDPQAPDVDVELFMENLSLDDWLSVVTVDNATGTGRLYGRLRLQVRTKPKLSVTLGEGFLHAEGDGTISIKDTEMAREVLDRHMPDQGGGEEDYNAVVKDRIVRTLEAFEFDDLKFDVTEKPSGTMSLRLHVAGKGREPPHQELDLTVNLNGFEELIGPALAVKLGLEEAKESMLNRLKIE